MPRRYNVKHKHTFHIGQMFGQRTVIDTTILDVFYANGIYPIASIRVKCVCGTEDIVQVSKLLAGVGTRCKKCFNGKLSNNTNWKGCGHIPGRYFNNLKRNAQKRNLDFDVSIEFLSNLYELQDGKCALTGDPIFFGEARKYTMETSASLDRIDNSIGYIETNVQFVSKKVNFAKHKTDQREFIDMCCKIAKLHGHNI